MAKTLSYHYSIIVLQNELKLQMLNQMDLAFSIWGQIAVGQEEMASSYIPKSNVESMELFFP